MSSFHPATPDAMERLGAKSLVLRRLSKRVKSGLKSGRLSIPTFLKSKEAHKLRNFRASSFIEAAMPRSSARELLVKAGVVGGAIGSRRLTGHKHGHLKTLIKRQARVTKALHDLKHEGHRIHHKHRPKRPTHRIALASRRTVRSRHSHH
jgi:hypothetical protein